MSHGIRSHPDVMVSSTFRDLEEYRSQLQEALLKEEFFPRMMELSVPHPSDDLISASLRLVQESDAYVGLISHRYGDIPESNEYNPRGFSLTRLEFEKAQQLGLPTLVFIMGENFSPLTTADVERDAEKLGKLIDFRRRAKSGRIYVEFDSPTDFIIQAIHAVAKLRTIFKETGGRDSVYETLKTHSPSARIAYVKERVLSELRVEFGQDVFRDVSAYDPDERISWVFDVVIPRADDTLLVEIGYIDEGYFDGLNHAVNQIESRYRYLPEKFCRNPRLLVAVVIDEHALSFNDVIRRIEALRKVASLPIDLRIFSLREFDQKD